MNEASDTRTDYVHRIETYPERPWDRDDDHADERPDGISAGVIVWPLACLAAILAGALLAVLA